MMASWQVQHDEPKKRPLKKKRWTRDAPPHDAPNAPALWLDESLLGVEATVRPEDERAPAQYAHCYKGAARFSLGDVVYVAAEPGAPPMIAQLTALCWDAELAGVSGALRWYYRYDDLRSEDVQGRDPAPSLLSRDRELWPCAVVDPNPMALVVGRLHVRDVGPASADAAITRDQLQHYLDASPHHFFTRRRVEGDTVVG